MKNKIICMILACIMLLFFGCSAKTDTVSVTQPIEHDLKFDCAMLPLTPSEFEQYGFSLGDSCDVEFENGYTLSDVPYYDGFYVKTGNPIIVAYPGFSDIRITFNNVGIWDEARLDESMSVTVRLNTRGKYAAIQESLGQSYSDERNSYASDEQFSNFRALSGGSMKPDFVFRGASPVDNSHGRASYTDSLLKDRQIGFIIDLADSEDNIKEYMAGDDFVSSYSESLIADGRAALCDMGSDYQSDEYREKLSGGIRRMMSFDPCPVYIHCMEGKDRTGFVCMLLEALAGASYDEMLADYMTTYDNYYGISMKKTPEKYDAVADLYFNTFMEYLHGTSDLEELKKADFVPDARAYLESAGMTSTEIDSLIEIITE